MIYAPTGIGGVIQHHMRHWKVLDWSRLALPYLAAILGGALIAAAVVFTTESVSITFGEEYAREVQALGASPDYHLFGIDWHPHGVLTWALPLALFAGGVAILTRARRRIDALWDVMSKTETGAAQ